MRRGDFASAWAVSDEILRRRNEAGVTCWDQPRHLQFVWRGESLADKRVLVRCYHGLGDTIQFVRFAAPLRRIAREVIVWAQPELLALVASVAGVDRVLPLHDGVPDVDYDADIEIMELPHALRVTVEALPGPVPYLAPPRLPAERAALSPGLSVGVIWQAGGWDPRRSMPAMMLRPLAEIAGVHLLSFQIGPAAAEAPRIGATDMATADATRVAQLLQRVDLVISVDTMAAHLAGALGRPVWTLLHADCDWRWMRERTDSVWYPTMRLFRQDRPGDWRGVVARLCAALAAKST